MSALSELLLGDDITFHALKESIKQEIRCCMPGVIVDYNPDTQTASIQPGVREKRSGTVEQLPLLLDVPVVFPGSASLSVSFEVSAGDECLIVFSDVCIDDWLQRGKIQTPSISRRHSLADGFAIPTRLSVHKSLPPADSNIVFRIGVPVGDGWATPIAITKSGVVVINGREV